MNHYRPKQGTGCGKILGCGCLAFVLFSVVLGIGISIGTGNRGKSTAPTTQKQEQKATDDSDQPLDPEAVPHATYSPDRKTVHVKGYFRKDGTYVQPHTRSPPRK